MAPVTASLRELLPIWLGIALGPLINQLDLLIINLAMAFDGAHLTCPTF